jgi:flagellar biosynthesis/type III secretory pathway chaperone
MSPTPHDWSLLNQLLQRDTANSEQLLKLLADERKALESRDYSTFETLVTPKQQLVQQLEQNLAVRRQHLHQMGFDNDLDALRAARTDATEVASCWESAATLWQDCQNASQINEQICRRTQLVVGRVLDALRGQHSQSTTYDASGAAERSSGGRTISSA